MMLQSFRLERVVMETAKWHAQDISFCLFSWVTSWFIRGVIKIRTLELNTVFYLPSSSSVLILLIVRGSRGSRVHSVCGTCISQAHNSCREPHTLLRLMENKFTNSSSSLCRNCSCTRDNFKLFITLFWLLKKGKISCRKLENMHTGTGKSQSFSACPKKMSNLSISCCIEIPNT